MTIGEQTATAALKSILERQSSEELLEIWQQHDTSKWGSNVFVVIKSILMSRNIEFPEQVGPSSNSSIEVPDVVEQKTSRKPSAVLSAGAIAACAVAVFVFMNSEKLSQRGGFIILLGAIGLGVLTFATQKVITKNNKDT